MFLPVKHPEDLRFRLSRIGIDPSNDTEVVCGYGCLRLLEHIVRLRKWRLPFAAFTVSVSKISVIIPITAR